MQKLILMSLLITTVVAPAVMARKNVPVLYATVLKKFLVFIGIYVALLLFVYPRLF